MCIVFLPAVSGSEGFVRLGKSEECLLPLSYSSAVAIHHTCVQNKKVNMKNAVSVGAVMCARLLPTISCRLKVMRNSGHNTQIAMSGFQLSLWNMCDIPYFIRF